jgi:hypothetical protein
MNAGVSASDALLLQRGREAWKTIKASRAMMHGEWYALGKALAVGRKVTPNGTVFRQWCAYNDLGGISGFAQIGVEEYAKADAPHGTLPLQILEWYRNRELESGKGPRPARYADEATAQQLKSPQKTSADTRDLVAVVARGQAAWASIKEAMPARRALSRRQGDKAQERRKKSNSEHLKWWRDVGQALAVGKRLNADGRCGAYGAWVKAKGFHDVPDRPSTIWLAENFDALGETPGDMTSPASIRNWASQREAAKHAPAPTAEDISLQHAADAITQASRGMTQCLQALRSATRALERAQQELQDALRLRSSAKRKTESEPRN